MEVHLDGMLLNLWICRVMEETTKITGSLVVSQRREDQRVDASLQENNGVSLTCQDCTSYEGMLVHSA